MLIRTAFQIHENSLKYVASIHGSADDVHFMPMKHLKQATMTKYQSRSAMETMFLLNGMRELGWMNSKRIQVILTIILEREILLI